MKVVAAYLLALLGGNQNPSADDIMTILGSVGLGDEVDKERIELLLTQVKGRDLAELIACGREKMASITSNGGAAAIAVAAPTVTASDAAFASGPVKEDKKEIVEESDDEMCFSLFD